MGNISLKKRVPSANLQTIGSEEKHVSSDKVGIRLWIHNSLIIEGLF